jgi:hypothetical protein
MIGQKSKVKSQSYYLILKTASAKVFRFELWF